MPVTIKDIAKMAGVSISTVSLVMNDRDKGQVSAERRAKVLALARRHGYRTNQAAKALVEQRTYRIALCHEANAAHYDLLQIYGLFNLMNLFASKFQSMGYSIEIFAIDQSLSNKAICESFLVKPVDAYVFMMMPKDRAEPYMRFLKKENRPAIASGTVLSDEFAWTDIDRANAFERAVKILVRQGHTRIGLLDASEPIYSKLKQTIFVKSMSDQLDVDASKWVFKASRNRFLDVLRVAEEMLAKIKDLTAIILTSTFFSEAVLQAIWSKGMKPGKDCRVVGFGFSEMARCCSPRISHFSLCIPQEVSFGIDTLIDAINNPDAYQSDHRIFRAKFVRGGT